MKPRQFQELVDEAFLRRLGYKIVVSYISEEEYSQIFKQYCTTNGLEFSQKFVDYLIQKHYKPNKKKLLASHPKALINKVAKEAEFFSFGTNDLTQMACGFSRDDAGKFLGDYVTAGIFEGLLSRHGRGAAVGAVPHDALQISMTHTPRANNPLAQEVLGGA